MHGIISGTPYEMKAGEFYFINSGELHELSTHNHSLHHAIVFDPKLLNFDLYDSCQHNFNQPITQKKLLFPNNISSVLNQKERESLRQLFLAVIYNYHHPEQCALLKIKICLLQILELCFRTEILIQNQTTGKQLSSMNQLKEVLDFIRSHYAEEITLKELCTHDLLLREKGSATRDIIDSCLYLRGLAAYPKWTSVNSKVLIEACKAGFGFAVLPTLLVTEELKHGTLKTVETDELLYNKTKLLYHQEKYISEPLAKLIDIIGEAE